MTLRNILESFTKDTNDGFRAFAEHPFKYTSKSLLDLVYDYWDVGLAVASGIAWTTPHGKDLYGEYAPYAFFFAPFATVALPSFMRFHEGKDRTLARQCRDFAVFLATTGLLNGDSETHLGLGNYGLGLGTLAMAIYFDHRMLEQPSNMKIEIIKNF